LAKQRPALRSLQTVTDGFFFPNNSTKQTGLTPRLFLRLLTLCPATTLRARGTGSVGDGVGEGPERAAGHRVSRPRGTGSVGDSVGEGGACESGRHNTSVRKCRRMLEYAL